MSANNLLISQNYIFNQNRKQKCTMYEKNTTLFK